MNAVEKRKNLAEPEIESRPFTACSPAVCSECVSEGWPVAYAVKTGS
jgi:hypothetical protein